MNENSDLVSVIHVGILMDSFHKPAFRPKMTAAFAVPSDSTCGTLLLFSQTLRIS